MISTTYYPSKMSSIIIECVCLHEVLVTGAHSVFAHWHHPAFAPITTPSKSSSKMTDDVEEEGDVDVLLADPDVDEPPMYAVVMYNDNYTPMDFVVYILQSQFRHDIDKAIAIMLDIHNNGRGIAGIYPKDIAETKAQQVNSTARKEGYPLLTQIEPYKD